METNCRNRLHVGQLQIVGALTAPTFMALTCRWRSRPRHQSRPWTLKLCSFRCRTACWKRGNTRQPAFMEYGQECRGCWAVFAGI